MRQIEESGTYVTGRIFGGQFCVRVPNDEVREGDYIEFCKQGTRCRRVKSVHRGRKHNYVQFDPSRYNPFKSQRIDMREVTGVWRPQPTLELWEDPEGGKKREKPLLPEWKGSVRKPDGQVE